MLIFFFIIVFIVIAYLWKTGRICWKKSDQEGIIFMSYITTLKVSLSLSLSPSFFSYPFKQFMHILKQTIVDYYQYTCIVLLRISLSNIQYQKADAKRTKGLRIESGGGSNIKDPLLTKAIFTHMETSPLRLKGLKFLTYTQHSWPLSS